MYYVILIAFSLTAIIGGWDDRPTLILIGGLFMGHALTEVMNNPMD